MGFERCENILGVFVLHILSTLIRLLHERTVSSSDTIWSLATIREVTMYIFFLISKCGSPVEPATLQVTNNNLWAHLANLLIYIQHFFQYS